MNVQAACPASLWRHGTVRTVIAISKADHRGARTCRPMYGGRASAGPNDVLEPVANVTCCGFASPNSVMASAMPRPILRCLFRKHFQSLLTPSHQLRVCGSLYTGTRFPLAVLLRQYLVEVSTLRRVSDGQQTKNGLAISDRPALSTARESDYRKVFKYVKRSRT
jgi:hypothetical protein